MKTQSAQQGSGEFDSLLATMRQLRNPEGGCPWDLQQTHRSLRATLLEESYEVLAALDLGDTSALVEELGDLLLQVVFHAQIGADEGTFTIHDVVLHLNQKLYRRHPHVFGDTAAVSSSEALEQWDAIKAVEREAKGQSVRSALDGVSKAMPALAYAQAAQERAARARFEWDQGQASAAAIIETLLASANRSSQAEREREFGDLLFALVNTGRRLGLEAEEALRDANRRFYQAFTTGEERPHQ